MIVKNAEKKKAIKLRREGKTYSEILNTVTVAKSTLSLWLKDVGLSKPQKQRLTKAKLEAGLRGALAKRKQRIEKQNMIFSQARNEIKNISKRELFLIGNALYWAEGSKEKEYRPGSSLQFSNMDPKMIIVFLKWLQDICNIPQNMIGFEIFLHQNHKSRIKETQNYWSIVTGFPSAFFSHIYFKKHKIRKTNRKNTAENYHGCLKVRVYQSSSLVRKIAGWCKGISDGIVKK